MKEKTHEEAHGPRALFDLWPEPPEKHIANLEENLKPGLECIVATRMAGKITFAWFEFSHEGPGQIKGEPCRVFYGDLLKTSKPYSQAQAAKVQPTFFNSLGRFNQWKALLR